VKSVADPAAKVKAIEPAVGMFWSPGPHIQSIYLNDLDFDPQTASWLVIEMRVA
jgi:hypothetical protein